MGIIEAIGGLFARPDGDAVLARVEALAAAGRLVDAVGYGDREARRLDDMRVYRRVAALRREAVAEVAGRTPPRPDWPPRLADPFPGVAGIPEIGGDALDTATMGGAILHHGSLLVRGLLGREEVDGLVAEIDGVYAEHDRREAGEWAAADRSRIALFPLGGDDSLSITRKWLRGIGGVWAVDCPAIFSRLVRLYRRTGLIDVIAGYLGERPVLSVGKTVLRRIEPEGSGDFHQDGSFLGAQARTVNVWIALSDCGVDAPGLEVVDRRLPAILPAGGNGARYPWALTREDALAANHGRRFAVPAFRAGDALIFDQMMLHSTGFAAGMDRRRHALEAWFFAPSAYPDDQIPLLI